MVSTRLEVQKNRGGGPNNLPGVPSSEKLSQCEGNVFCTCCTKVDSPFRNRSVEENLRLFEEMQAGKHAEGSLLLPGQDRHESSEHEHAGPAHATGTSKADERLSMTCWYRRC